MTNPLNRAVRTILALAGIAAASPAMAAFPTTLHEQIGRATDWWPGEYDNHEQVIRQTGTPYIPPVTTPFRHFHTVVRTIASPDIKDPAILVSRYEDDDPTKLNASELYVFSEDAGADAIRVRRYRQTAHRSAALPSPAPAPVIDLKDFEALPAGCDLMLRYIGNQFEGGTEGKACKAPGGYEDNHLILGKTNYWIQENVRRTKDDVLVTGLAPKAPDGWFMQTRARRFNCYVRQGGFKTNEFLTLINLHDQGGSADIDWPDGRKLSFTIQTRASAVPDASQSALFSVLNRGEREPLAYAWAPGGSTRFGLNLGWFYIRCYDDHDPNPLETPLPPAPPPRN